MRVLMTTDTIGGVWTYTKVLAAELLARDFRIALVSFGGAPSTAQAADCRSLQEQGGDSFIYVSSEIPLEWMQNNQDAFRLGAEILTRIAREFRPDLLHSSQFCFGALPLRIPKVVVAHSDVFSWARACLPESWLASSPWLARYSLLVRNGLSGATSVVAPTHWMRRALMESFSVPCGVEVIYNGRTLGLQPGANERLLQAVTAGRLWDEAKNLGILSGVRSPFPLLIAGESSHGRATLSHADLDATFLGPLAEEELFALFARSSVYLCTSKYEPFGLAPLEAAACGCAIVAHNIPSLHEIWEEAALYFDSGASLEALLHRLCEEPAFLLEAGERSYRRSQEFSAARMTGLYTALLQNLLAPVETCLYG